MHIASKCVDDHPDKAVAAVGAVDLKTTANTMGAMRRESMKELAAEVKEELAMSSRLRRRVARHRGPTSQMRQCPTSGSMHLDRELPDEEVSLR